MLYRRRPNRVDYAANSAILRSVFGPEGPQEEAMEGKVQIEITYCVS